MKKETLIKKLALTCLVTLALCSGVRAEDKQINVNTGPFGIYTADHKDIDLTANDTVQVRGHIAEPNFKKITINIKPENNNPNVPVSDLFTSSKTEDTSNPFAFDIHPQPNQKGNASVSFIVEYKDGSTKQIPNDKDPVFNLHLN